MPWEVSTTGTMPIGAKSRLDSLSASPGACKGGRAVSLRLRAVVPFFAGSLEPPQANGRQTSWKNGTETIGESKRGKGKCALSKGRPATIRPIGAMKLGRGERIRTSDSCVPKTAVRS